MTTFSQIVDELYTELVRPDMIRMLPDYLNQTLRELHYDSRTNTPVFYSDNRQEDELTVTGLSDSNTVFLWEIPIVAQLQAIEAIYYDYRRRYARLQNPTIARLHNMSNVDDKYYWYRTGKYIAFSGHGGNNQKIQISWFEFPRALMYYYAKNRPVTYDIESQMYVVNAAYRNLAGQPITADQAIAYSTNWILDRHPDLLKEGVRSKAYKRMGDNDRASRAYSLYETMRAGMLTGETIDFTPHYNK
jgi:hypothetical protein